MSRPPKPSQRIRHGTEKAYRWHLRQDEQACVQCKRAHAEYTKKQRARRRRQEKVLRSIINKGQATQHDLTDGEFQEILREIRKEINEA